MYADNPSLDPRSGVLPTHVIFNTTLDWMIQEATACTLTADKNGEHGTLACLPRSVVPQVHVIAFEHVGNQWIREPATISLRAGQHLEKVLDHTTNGMHTIRKAAQALLPVGEDAEWVGVDREWYIGGLDTTIWVLAYEWFWLILTICGCKKS